MSERDGGIVVGEDGLARSPWVGNDALLREYYDTEWGMPVRTEDGLFERLSLEVFQAGLSWATVLRKRSAFRQAFDGFDPEKVAKYSDAEVEQLATDASIIRNRAKIRATIKNAQATLRLREEGGLSAFLWSFQPENTPKPRTISEIPTQSPEAEALASALRKRGFTFVGPTNIYATMAAIGMVDVHLMDSHRRGCSGLWPE